MKNRCYPKCSYAICFFIATIMLIFSMGPMFIWTNDATVIKIVWSISMFIFCIIFCLCGMHYMQHFYFDDGYLVVKSVFGTIVKLDIGESIAYIETLPTYSSWVASFDEKWICVYDKNIADNVLCRFKSGCANKRNYKRVQIICSEQNKKLIEQYVLIQKRKCLWDSSIG